MMKKISDERLEKMLTNYCEADSQQTFTFDPEKKSEKIVPFVRFRKQLIAAASLVLVSVLSLIIYFSFGNINNTPLTVAPSQHKLITPSSTEGGGDDPDQQDGADQNGSKSLFQRIHDSFFPEASEESGASSERGGSSAAVSPTEQGNGSAGRSPSRRNPSTIPSATQPSDQSLDPPPKATEAGASTPITEPTTEPDTPPYIPPTEPIDPPWNDPEPTEGDEPGLIPPSEGGVMTGAPVEVYARFDSSLMVGVTGVYCKVYSYDNLIGSSDLYDRSHSADILDSASGKTDVLYETPEGLIRSVGEYVFVFYDQNGNELAQVNEFIY